MTDYFTNVIIMAFVTEVTITCKIAMSSLILQPTCLLTLSLILCLLCFPTVSSAVIVYQRLLDAIFMRKRHKYFVLTSFLYIFKTYVMDVYKNGLIIGFKRKFTAGFSTRIRSDAIQNFRHLFCYMKYIILFLYVVIRKKYSPFCSYSNE